MSCWVGARISGQRWVDPRDARRQLGASTDRRPSILAWGHGMQGDFSPLRAMPLSEIGGWGHGLRGEFAAAGHGLHCGSQGFPSAAG